MIQINIEAAKVFAIEATNQLKANAKEDVLRHLLSAHLPLMFPENPWWIQEHTIGIESNVKYVSADGLKHIGFVDSLVGKTVIEYEKNLTNNYIFNEGYNQVKQYCSALLNRNNSYKDIIGVLSDTVHWYAFSVCIEHEPSQGYKYGPHNISLKETEYIDLENYSNSNLTQFGIFINRYLGREGSRQLDAVSLALDMGFGSVFCKRHMNDFHKIVDSAFKNKEHYGKMISSLWKNFVTCFDGNATQKFDRNVYSNELYMITLSKLLCANILQGSVIRNDEKSLVSILNGQWFKEKGFVNIVEYDYFGWLNEIPFVKNLYLIAQDMQNDFAAYDFKNVVTEDLFGPLVAQLAEKDRRLLLGQEFTPQWISKRIVSYVLEMLPKNEYPAFIDMCCGSGVFIVETLKQTIAKNKMIPSECTSEALRSLMSCVIGFDIDPLSVILSKMNWAMTMRDFIPFIETDLFIPIYHADSLFTVAPITGLLDGNYATQSIQMIFDGEKVMLPGFLISPENRNLFDVLIQTCYETAKALAIHTAVDYRLHKIETENLVKRILRETNTIMNENNTKWLIDSSFDLILVLEKLQREERNGIWPFLLGNNYRPGLIGKQFNAIVSNPPWLTMSKLLDNPYKATLTTRAEYYGIKPTGSSHLHIELATVFLLHSIDKYLKEDGIFGIVMPDTLLNGFHHEPFRKQQFLNSKWSVDMNVNEIWELPIDTFKNKAIILFGKKEKTSATNTLNGRYIHNDEQDKICKFRLLKQGRRTAWSSNPSASEVEEVLNSIPFQQGADIMPRTLVFHKTIKQPNNKWSLQPIPRKHDDLSYLVSEAKKNVDFSIEAKNIDNQFIYDCYMSNHILPFLSCAPAKALLPMRKDGNRWCAIDEVSIAMSGTPNKVVFSHIFSAAGENANQYFERINYRNKLNQQQFEKNMIGYYLVLAGAGGDYTCATYIPMMSIDMEKTIIDQTLYWYIAKTEDEAIYITALLNSCALNSIIADFQPEGAMGRRHVHKLPYAVTPSFDSENDAHLFVVKKARLLKSAINTKFTTSDAFEYLSPSHSNLAVRRRKIREFIYNLSESDVYETACRVVYGV